MDYYAGFCFRLDYYNKIWWNYYETLNTSTVSTTQIVRYFIKELGSQFEKIYKDFIDVDSVSNKSLELSRQVIQDWDEKYENGLYKINSVCCVAIPGFIYKTAPTDSHTLYDSINDKIDSFGLLSDEEYIELIEKIFMMRFGIRPQDSKTKEVEFFIPAMLPVFSTSLNKKSFNVLADYKLPDDEDIYVDGYFYIKDTGEYVGHSGDSEDCYAVTEKKLRYCSDGQIVPCYSVRDAEDLKITHEDFCYIGGVLINEDDTNFEVHAALVQTVFNAVILCKGNKLTLDIKIKYAKKLLASDYSSVSPEKKLPFSDENSERNKNMCKAIIHVILGGQDYSAGAVFWDGCDFVAFGTNHNKVNGDYAFGISITKKMWNNLLDCYFSEENSSFKYSGVRTRENCWNNIPFLQKESEIEQKKEIEKIKKYCPNLYLVTKDLFETTGKGVNNKERVLIKACSVKGKTIFWKPNINEPKNNGYIWKKMIDNRWLK